LLEGQTVGRACPWGRAPAGGPASIIISNAGLTPDERLRWFEHNVYYALVTSDEYVWCYSERMHWWQDKVPDGTEAAIRSARTKIAEGQPLGFDIGDFIAAGQRKMNDAAKKKE
jgi:hypothetical protein